MKFIQNVPLMTLSLAVCGMAYAVEITTDTTVSVSADSAESYEIAGGATLTFSVASGAYTLSGVITGDGAVRKEGSGELILSNSANSFSGGMYNSQGTLRATASGAFGTGCITNNGPAKLAFDVQGGVFPNSICMTGVNSNVPADPLETVLQFHKDTTLQGDITSVDANLVMANSRTTSSSPGAAKGPHVAVMGKVKVASGYVFQVNTYGTNTFNGVIDDSGNQGYAYFGKNWSSSGTIELASPENKWNLGIQIYSEVISCLADNVISNASFYWSYATTGKNPYGDYMSSVKLNGHSQRIRSLRGGGTTLAASENTGYMITSTGTPTLTILGESTSRECNCRIQDKITVVLDAKSYPNFVQTIYKRTCPTSGDLAVSNGTLRLTDTASFPNVPNIVIAPGGTLDVRSTAALPLKSVTNLVLEGKLLATTATGAGLSQEKVEMTLGNGAEFHLGADDTLILKSLRTAAGPVAADIYTAPDERIPQLKSGILVVLPSGASVSASWTGEGETDAINDAANWSNPDAEVLTGTLSALFADGGDHADVSGIVRFGDLSFSPASGTAGFTFDAADGTALLEAYGGSMTFTGPGSNVFNLPVRIARQQSWTFSQGSAVHFSTNFASVSGVIAMNGAGDLSFNGPTTFTGGMIVTNGLSLHVNGATLSAADGIPLVNPSLKGETTLTLYGNDSTRLVLSNATVRMPVYMQATIGKSPIVAEPASTNVILGAVYQGSAWSGFNIPAGSEIILRGGLKSTAASPRFAYPGTVRVQEKPVSAPNSIGWNQVDGKLILEMTNNTFAFLTTGYQSGNYSPVIDFRVSGAVTNGFLVNAMVFQGNSIFVPCTSTGFNGTIEFNATTQRVDSLVGFARGTFRGDAGSLLEVRKQVVTGQTRVSESTLYVASEISGALSLKMAGTGDLVLTNRAFSSTGNLEVVSGTLTLRENATWLNGSNVTVRGSGTLRLDAGERFGKHVEMHLGADGDSWSIAMPNGGMQRVAALYADDGTLLPSGFYGAAGVAGVTQTRYAAHFTGTGLLKVGRFGTRFILQ